MKKILLIISMMAIAIPALAFCSLTGGGNCSAYSMTTPKLQDKYMPNNLQNIQKPDAFRPQYVQPYNSALINTETGGAAGSPSDYNSNCQFGICLPGVAPNTGGTIE